MKKQWFAITATVAGAMTVLLVLLWLMEGTGLGVSTPALARSARRGVATDGLTPTVTTVMPAAAPNDVDVAITIHGGGFTATLSGTQVITAPLVYLGDNVLPGVIWVDTATLTATVQWGLEPKVYTLTVINPDGISATLQNAFTVTQGIGEFVTGGPYGGRAVQLALKPGVSSTVYATMFGAGLFISENAAENWEPIHNHDWPIHLDFDSQNPDVLYFGADSNDLYRSMDNGSSWERISDDFHTQNGCFRSYPVAHPSQAGAVYFGMGGCGSINLEPGEGGVFYSTDYGDTWISRTQGLSDLDVQSLAIHPNSPGILLAGTQDGDLFYSVDGGLNWTWSTQLTGTVTRLYFNPYQALEAWAATDSEAEGRGYLYRSTNLTAWTTINIHVPSQGGSAHIQMDFLPGSVWLASQSVYSSTDGGVTWNALNGPNRSAAAIAIAADSPQVIYVGTDFGIEKSADGGGSWQEMNEGLAALVPSAVVALPSAPETVYVKTFQGIFLSHNGGNDWQNLDYGAGGGPGGNLMAADNFLPAYLYLRANCSGQFCIEYSPDGGSSWNLVTSTLPTTYTNWNSDSPAITPSPHIPGRILVGAALSPPDGGSEVGVFYRSDDYGMSWGFIEPTQTISHITEIAYDAFNASLIYAATAGSGLWRSTDGGDHWESVSVANVRPPIVVGAIAVHPNVPNKVHIRTSSYADTPNPEPELWVSEDAGASWQPLTYVFLGVDLVVAPPLSGQLSYSLYTGCERGLCRSMDDGTTWISLEGVPRPEILTAASDGRRSVIYMGTPGGLASRAGAQAASMPTAISGDFTILGGGVYRLTVLLRTEFVYLPLVVH